MGLFTRVNDPYDTMGEGGSRTIKPAGEDVQDGWTYHGSGPQRSILKHGMQARRHQDAKHKIGRTRGHDADQGKPRGSGDRPPTKWLSW